MHSIIYEAPNRLIKRQELNLAWCASVLLATDPESETLV